MSLRMRIHNGIASREHSGMSAGADKQSFNCYLGDDDDDDDDDNGDADDGDPLEKTTTMCTHLYIYMYMCVSL